MVKDGNGNLAHDEEIEITQPAAYFDYTMTPPSCFQGSDGSIELTIIDNQPVMFEWEFGSTDLVRTDLQHGSYPLQATLGSCVANIDIIVTEPDSLYSEIRIENICDVGEKGKVTLTQKGGTGLGLSISKAIIEKHCGQIDYESEDGIGTTFFFELPKTTN